MDGVPVSRRSSGSYIYWIAALLTATAVYTCCCGTPLIWDGAFQYATTLVMGKPYVYLTRFHTLILWRPLVWLSRYTDNFTALKLAYGLPFCMAPVVGLLASWWVVRRRAPWLIVWAVFGICIAPLPGEIFVINDSQFQQALFWPIFLAALVPITPAQGAVLLLLALFQFVHQIGLVLLGGATGAALLMAWQDRANRRALLAQAGALGWLTMTMLAKVWITSRPASPFYDSYAAAEFNWPNMHQRWIGGVYGPPFYGMKYMWAAGVLVFVRARIKRSDSTPARRLACYLTGAAFACVVIGAVRWVAWACNEHAWAWALEYRRWLVPLTAPFYVLCFLETFLHARGNAPVGATPASPASPDHAFATVGATPASPASTALPPAYKNVCEQTPRTSLCYLLAAVFAAVITIQSTVYAVLIRRLMDDVSRYPGPVVPREALQWSHWTPLDHWGLTDLVIAQQGKRPRKLLLFPHEQAALYRDPPLIPDAAFYPAAPNPGPNGYFDLRPVIREARAAGPPK